MENIGSFISHQGVEIHGIRTAARIYWNLSPPQLYEEAVRRREGVIARYGPLVVETGEKTGRSPNDRFFVREPGSEGHLWWGEVNQGVEEGVFQRVRGQVQAYLQGRDLFVFDGYVGADPQYRRRVRVITELAWHNLFARNMFVGEEDGERLRDFRPDLTVIDAAHFTPDPGAAGTRSSTFILIHLGEGLVLIGGTAYAGEIKKSVFTMMNYLLPRSGVLSMHCSANYGRDRDDVALFFGLSGTGKTTLSADSSRTLIGDDEHGWSEDGVFNLEGGCYAKVIRLSPTGEPEIYQTTRRFGTILENVIYRPDTRDLDLDDDSRTENTRASYPVTHLNRVDPGGMAGHPRHIIFLTCDAFGVLPPISKLTLEQALYHFLSGYTAKVAGTEEGVTEPCATFSTCFGAPFMPLHPGVYARMLGEKIRRHGVRVWLINTGWTGGPYGVGKRIELAFTRKMIAAALSGQLDEVDTVVDPLFGLAVPRSVPGVPDKVLRPRDTWANPADYDAQASRLADMFAENFETFENEVSEEIRAAGPRRIPSS